MIKREREKVISHVLARFRWRRIKRWLPECSDEAIEFCEETLKMEESTVISLKHFRKAQKKDGDWTNWFIDILVERKLLKGNEIVVFLQEYEPYHEEELTFTLIRYKGKLTSKQKSEIIRKNLRGDPDEYPEEFLRAVVECDLDASDVFSLLNELDEGDMKDYEDDVADILIKHKRKLTSRQKTKIIRKLKSDIYEFLRTILKCDLDASDVFSLLNEFDEGDIEQYEDNVVNILIKHKRKLTSKQKSEIIRKLKSETEDFLRAILKCDLDGKDAIPLLLDVDKKSIVYYQEYKKMADAIIKHKDDATTEEKLAIIEKIRNRMEEFLRAILECDLDGDGMFDMVLNFIHKPGQSLKGHEKMVAAILTKYAKPLRKTKDE